jgi:hypothetical protein
MGVAGHIGQIYKVATGSGPSLKHLWRSPPTGEGPQILDDFYIPNRGGPFQQGIAITAQSLACATLKSSASLTGRAVHDKALKAIRDAKKIEFKLVAVLGKDGKPPS